MAEKIADAFVEISARTVNFDVKTKGVRKRLADINRGFGKFTKTAGLFGAAFGAIGVLVAKSALMASSSMELLEGRMVTLLGSTKKAADAMKFFGETAAKVPFSIEDVTEAGVTLTAMGASFKKWLPLANDVAAVMGVDLKVAASQLGRAFAGGGAAADIFREKGILAIIKESSGIRDFSKSTLPEFREAMFAAFTDPGGKIAGASGRLATTLVGQFSMVQDAFFKIKVAIGETLTPAIQELISQVRPLLQQWVEFLSNNKELSDSFLNVAKGFTDFKNTVVLAIFNIERNWIIFNEVFQKVWEETTGFVAKGFLLATKIILESMNDIKNNWLFVQGLFSAGISTVLIPVSEKWSKAFGDSAMNILGDMKEINIEFTEAAKLQDKLTRENVKRIEEEAKKRKEFNEAARKGFIDNLTNQAEEEQALRNKNFKSNKSLEEKLTDVTKKENDKRKIEFLNVEDIFKKIQESTLKANDRAGKVRGLVGGKDKDVGKEADKILKEISNENVKSNNTLKSIDTTLKQGITVPVAQMG